MEEYSDEVLIQQVLGGDRTAFGILVDRHREAVHTLLIHRYAFSVRNKWLDMYWQDKESQSFQLN